MHPSPPAATGTHPQHLGPPPFGPGPDAPPGFGSPGFAGSGFAGPGFTGPAGPGFTGPVGPGGRPPVEPGEPWAGAPAPLVPSSLPLPLPALAGVAGVLLLALGLSIPFDSSCAWAMQTVWAIFAVVSALVAQTPLVAGRAGGRSARTAWYVGAAGTGGVLAYWLLVALPGVASNQGFVVTAGAALVAAGCWFSPLRPR